MTRFIYCSISFLSFIFFLNFTLFYLDDFKLSQNKYIRTSQIITPISLLLVMVILFYLNFLTLNVGPLLSAGHYLAAENTTNNTVSIGGSVEMNRYAAELIGRNIGIAGTVAGVSGAVGKAIYKSSLPPLQKAGIVVGAAIAGGAIHVVTSVINRVVNTPSYTATPPSTTPPTTSGLGDGVNVADSGDGGSSDLMLLLLSIDTLISVSLGLIFIFFIMILFKFYLNKYIMRLFKFYLNKYKVKLNLSSLIGDKMNNYLNNYLIILVELVLYIFLLLFFYYS